LCFTRMYSDHFALKKLKVDPRNYGILTDLNTRPRTSYLAKLRNPELKLDKFRIWPSKN